MLSCHRRFLAIALVAASLALAACGSNPSMASDPDGSGGLPSTWQPWEWTGYEKFPSLYFAANPDGPYTPEQLDKITRFELAIVEYRAGQYMEEFTTGLWAGGDLGGFMDEQAERIAIHDGPPTLVYRSAQWASTMFQPQRQILERQHLFLADDRDCWGFIDYPLDVGETGAETGLSYCRWDVRQPEARRAFMQIVERAAEGQSSGVFFDNAHSVACDEARQLSHLSRAQRKAFMDQQHELYADAFAFLVAHGKYPILSTTIGFTRNGPQVPWENDCPRSEEALLQALDGIPFARNNEFWMWNLGETATRQVRNAIDETLRGIPTIVHTPYFPSGGGCLGGCFNDEGERIRFTQQAFLEFSIAAFLVTMGPGDYFGFSNMEAEPEGGGWFDESWVYHDIYDTIRTGAPLGPPIERMDGNVFVRRFERGTVSIDTHAGTYDLDFQYP